MSQIPYIGHGRNFVIYETPKSATNSVFIFQDRTMLIDFSFGIFLNTISFLIME